MYVCMYVRMYVCAYVRMCVCVYVRMYVCTYVRMFVCMHDIPHFLLGKFTEVLKFISVYRVQGRRSRGKLQGGGGL